MSVKKVDGGTQRLLANSSLQVEIQARLQYGDLEALSPVECQNLQELVLARSPLATNGLWGALEAQRKQPLVTV